MKIGSNIKEDQSTKKDCLWIRFKFSAKLFNFSLKNGLHRITCHFFKRNLKKMRDLLQHNIKNSKIYFFLFKFYIYIYSLVYNLIYSIYFLYNFLLIGFFFWKVQNFWMLITHMWKIGLHIKDKKKECKKCSKKTFQMKVVAVSQRKLIKSIQPISMLLTRHTMKSLYTLKKSNQVKKNKNSNSIVY